MNPILSRQASIPLVLLTEAGTFLVLILADARMRRGELDPKWDRRLHAAVLIVFLILFCWFTLLCRQPYETRKLRLTPFLSLRLGFRIKKGRLTVRRLQAAREVLLNVLLCIPLGYALPSLLKNRKHPYLLTVLLGFALSLCTEVLQYATKLGIAEVDDLMYNTLGVVIGTTAWLVWRRAARRCNHLQRS